MRQAGLIARIARLARALSLLPWAAAGISWAGAVIAAGSHAVRPPWDRLIDCVTVCATVWAIIAAYSGSRREQEAANRRLVTLLADVTRERPAAEARLRQARLGYLRAAL